jgi:phosphatidylserine decarboxylase
MLRRAFARLAAIEALNFAFTNLIPRRRLTRAMARFAKIETPWVRDASIAAWRFACEVDLSDAATTAFPSLHAAFTRALVPGARPFDPDPAVLASPCDAIVGACGAIGDGLLVQAKGRRYRLAELLGDAGLAAELAGGAYATLRLTAGMYHRFHAPCDLVAESVLHLPGDVWNVNPPALARIDRLYCRNERAVIAARAGDGATLALVAVGAVLVASVRLIFADLRLSDGRAPRRHVCAAPLARGAEMGWFEHGSTIVLLAPRGFRLDPGVESGRRVRAGVALMRCRAGASG